MKPIRLPQQQRGIATILVVLLAGTALTATVLGVSYAVRGAQDKTLSMHASTTAQARAWTGVELVRQYLKQESLATPPWTSLPWTPAITGISSNDLSAKVVAVSGPDASGHYSVTADITGAGAASTASLRTVYDVTPAVAASGSSSSGPNIDAANFYYDLNMTGGIVIKGGSNANFNVLGNVTLSSASIDGVNSIKATGNVSVGSGIKVNSIYSNGDVSLTGSSAIASVSALGNVYANSSGLQSVVNCNGAIVITNGSTGTVNARGAITASSGGTHGTLNTNSTTLVTNGTIDTVNAIGSVILSGGVVRTTNTMGSDTWTSTGAGATTINANSSVTYAASGGTINAIGDVILTGGGASTVKSKGNVFVRSYGGISSLQCAGGLQVDQYASVSGTIGGLLIKLQQYNSGVNVSVIPGFSPSVASVALTPIAALQPYSLSRPTIDAYTLKTSANYQFEYQLTGYTKITVSNVAGISGGEYALVSDASKKDFLCPLASFNAVAKTCAVSGSSAKTICQGYSPQNSCFTYALNKWTIAGISLAPGAMWFDGDLEVSTGTYFNSFIATGNIVTSGAHITKAVNTASYGAICNNTPTDGVTQTSYFSGLYPSNFCNTTTSTLRGDPLGNIAFVAGGYKAGLFVGGNITLGASTKTWGTVIAGNLFNSGGSTTVYGYVAAAGQGTLSGVPNLLSGSTTIDLTSLPATYSPTTLPCMSGCTPAAASTGDASVLWSRYL
ncbi:hypothetical protein [Hydrocarboniphaga sp.]|uniref:hypothetical protein n=1 Tax=Hydrocarboniphaga sp. TaxID=2033016 RepID=UPI003D14B6C7